jgi:hypothetical protein
MFILIHCFAGCSPNDVLEAVGLSMTDLFPDGAIRDFMASAATKPKKKENTNHYKRLNEAWLRNFEEERANLKSGERFTDETLRHAREMYKRSKA